ncbi:hypothetical protein AK830_g2001 [Neonectria ditissima]|uniref:Uncharacterized protein n=1 Tax=Neonectria ditissima TaxID=78410 RepID=A0A0P7BGU4_9HYPO|nr:hypothetical protein AK830_g2001 [Neonectria ditissima]
MPPPSVAPSDQDDEDLRSAPGSPSTTQAPNASTAQSVNADTTASGQPTSPTSSSSDSGRLSVSRASPVGSPTLSEAGPPSSRLQSNDANANSPAYSLLELEAHLSPEFSQTLQLYFHRQWHPQPNGPAVLHFRDGSIKRLVGPVDVAAAPYVRVQPPVDLFTVDDEIDDNNSASNINGDDFNTTNSASSSAGNIHDGGDNTSGSEGSARNQVRELVTASLSTLCSTILVLLSVAVLSLLLGAWDLQWALAISPVPVPFPIHQPILQLAVTLEAAVNPSKVLMDHLRRVKVDLDGNCHVPRHWTKFCQGEITDTAGLHDNAHLLRDGRDPTRKIFHGADEELMCSIALSCANMEDTYDKAGRYLHDIQYGHLRGRYSKAMVGFTASIRNDLDNLRIVGPKPANPTVTIMPVVVAYLKAFKTRIRRTITETIREVDVMDTRGQGHIRKNPRAWHIRLEGFDHYITMTELVRNATDCFDSLDQTLQHLEVISKPFRDAFYRVPASLDNKNQEYFSRKEVDSISNTTMLSQARQSLEPIAKRINASRNQLVALHNALHQMAWLGKYELPLTIPDDFGHVTTRLFGNEPYHQRVEWQKGLNFWSSVWVAVGLKENAQSEAQNEYDSGPPFGYRLLTQLPDSFRPGFPVVLPLLQTQIDSLEKALSIFREINKA